MSLLLLLHTCLPLRFPLHLTSTYWYPLANLTHDRKIGLAKLESAGHVVPDLGRIRKFFAIPAVPKNLIHTVLALSVRAVAVLTRPTLGIVRLIGALAQQIIPAPDRLADVVAVRPPAARDGAGDGGAEAVYEAEVAIVEIGVGFTAASREVELNARIAG